MQHMLVPAQVPHFLNLQAVNQQSTCNICRHVLEEVAYLSCMRLKFICACAWVWYLAYYSWWVKSLAEYLEAVVHAAADHVWPFCVMQAAAHLIVCPSRLKVVSSAVTALVADQTWKLGHMVSYCSIFVVCFWWYHWQHRICFPLGHY